MTEIADRLQQVRERMCQACQRAGRDPASVQLVAVSKKQPAEQVLAAYQAGQRDFGENYGQELRDKAEQLAGQAPELRWHFIGPIQRNKVRYVARHARLVHTLSRPDIAAQLQERARREANAQGYLLEVNMAREPQKAGVTPEQVAGLLTQLGQTGLAVAGLMCMPPFDASPVETAGYFSGLRVLAEHLAGEGLLSQPCELSMGMSHDFELAIEHGATLVRVGTAIFGARGG